MAAKKPALSPDQRAEISAALGAYGARLTEDDRIAKGDKVMSVRLDVKGARLRALGGDNVLASYPASRAGTGVSDFVEKFWYWKKSPARLDAEIAEALAAKPSHAKRKAARIVHVEAKTPAGYRWLRTHARGATVTPEGFAVTDEHAWAQSLDAADAIEINGRGSKAGHATKTKRQGVSDNPRWEFVQMNYRGRHLLGQVRDTRKDPASGKLRLIVHHFNGEPWPVEPLASAVSAV